MVNYLTTKIKLLIAMLAIILPFRLRKQKKKKME